MLGSLQVKPCRPTLYDLWIHLHDKKKLFKLTEGGFNIFFMVFRNLNAAEWNTLLLSMNKAIHL